MRRWWLWLLIGLGVVGIGAAAWVWFGGGTADPPTGLTAPPVEGSGEVYAIAQGGSTATFEIDEELRGRPNRVVGSTSDVVGNIRVDTADASASSVGTIIISARTFATDSAFRDRAIRGPVILNSADDDFEFITFEPISVEGLSGPIVEGEELDFQVTGNLTVRGATAPVTFDVTAALRNGNIEGTAETTINRSDFGIGIPSVPSVANVSEEVLIRLDFVAAPA
ncbi:MAG TPA: YceI family protein [Acidimicrobiia bacterium]|jgi:polyisoprenoid-binding protein YceI